MWYKVRIDGGPDRRGVGFYFRNVTEMVLFGVKGHMRTLDPGRSMPNVIISRKREHSRKPDQLYEIIQQCSPGPYLELFCRVPHAGWTCWGDEAENYEPRKSAYSESQSERPGFELHAEDGTRLFENESKYEGTDGGTLSGDG